RRCRRASVHLPPAQEARMSPGSSHARHLAEAGRLANEIRLSVEQVSYAYSANPAQAPLFTLEATSFQARPGEIVAILGPNASGESLHRRRRHARAESRRRVCRSSRLDAARTLLACRSAHKHLSARIARAGFPDAAYRGAWLLRPAACHGLSWN